MQRPDDRPAHARRERHARRRQLAAPEPDVGRLLRARRRRSTSTSRINYDEATWVNFKLFGLMGLTLVFALAQGAWIARKADAAADAPEGN
ncbi:MAG: septation protein IspZ [Chromatiales bacterium]|nr:septation protein IspZ [Chromatiales bacterium]